MSFPQRSYIVYVDDSGNENVGSLWTGLAIPLDLWTEYLKRWLGFRSVLYGKHAIPASFELHAQAWLAIEPERHIEDESQRDLVMASGQMVELLQRNKAQRRMRSQMFEKGLKTIGTFTDARIFTVFKAGRKGKMELYGELLCFLEEFLAQEGAHATVMVDGGHDSGGHLHKCHRALEIRSRRVVEDAGMRRSHESQLLQMADWCAHAAFQSVQERVDLDERFKRQYETSLKRLIVRPFDQDEGRCIRGLDYASELALV
ncbi:MAG TPA: DUF3800 domain-containing protein [Solirubrobacterales bacterium]|nr:DUF3800 domain-containing protein [Solirubrobacterales bacterium]